MTEQKFQAGDLVRLKSGGPKMTAVEYGKYDYGTTEQVMCKWFDERNKVVTGLFTEAELEAVHDVSTAEILSRGSRGVDTQGGRKSQTF